MKGVKGNDIPHKLTKLAVKKKYINQSKQTKQLTATYGT